MLPVIQCNNMVDYRPKFFRFPAWQCKCAPSQCDTSAAASGNVVGLNHINGVDVVAHESTGSQEGYPAYIGAPTLNVRIRRGYVS